MLRAVTVGALLGAAAGGSTQVSFSGLNVLLEFLIALGAMGTLVAGIAAWRKSRREDDLNAVQSMEILLRNLRQQHLEKITEMDQAIAGLAAQLQASNGERVDLQAQLVECRRERDAVAAQVAGLNATLVELEERERQQKEAKEHGRG